MINLLFNTGKKFPIAFVCNNTIKVGDVVKINEKPYYITCVPGTVTPSGNISKFYYCVNASVTFKVTNTVKYISKRQREYEQLIRDKIAWDVDDKMLYLDTCPNERDIILSIISPNTYKHIQETHCNRDCEHIECGLYNFIKKNKNNGGINDDISGSK